MSKLGLRLPNVSTTPAADSSEITQPEVENRSKLNVARFISEGDRRPESGYSKKGIPKNFRLQRAFIDVLDEDAARTGLGQTDILKAAIAAWRKFDDNEKNYWILDSKKM